MTVTDLPTRIQDRADKQRSNRREDTKTLLAALTHLDPAPKPTPLAKTAGFTTTGRWLTCDDCLANGRIRSGCETCGGRGEIPDPVDRDPYEIPGGFYDLDQRRRDRQRDAYAEERRLGQLLDPAGDQRPATSTDTLEQAANACGATIPTGLLRAGSFPELLAALTWLHARYPAHHGCVLTAWRDGRYQTMTHAGQARADQGLELLTRRMPVRIRVPAWLRANGAVRRRRSVAELVEAGAGTSVVAAELGVSHEKAKKLVRAAKKDAV